MLVRRPTGRLTAILAVAAILASLGCAGRAWRHALDEDTAAAYHRYLRDHPDSSRADEARARLAFVRVRSKPSVEAFERFEAEHSGSPLVDALRPHVETAFFDAARARGTAEAYRAFLAEFKSGEHARRALGNAVYLEARGFSGDLARLSAFAAEHPESDFAAEVERSVAAASLRGRTRFGNVGLVIDVPASVPTADRLRRLFAERAVETYRRSGVPLVPMRGTTDPRLRHVGARLTISHREREVQTELEAGRVVQPGVLAETTVVLAARGAPEAVWSETVTFKAPVSERVAGESILLHPRAWAQYWERDFFVPVASWDNRETRRPVREFQKPVVAIQGAGSRTVVLFGDGDFQMLDLADPEHPEVLAEYRRKRDLAHFDGVAVIPSGVAVFGPDGIELVSLEGGAHRERVFPRSEVGSVIGLVAVREGLIAAGNRGLLLLGEVGSVRTLVPREVLGLASHGQHLFFTDGISLYAATPATLLRGRVEGELRLGRGFRPARVRVVGSQAVVLGDPGVLRVDVSQPSRPRVISRIGTDEVGEIQDASLLAGRLLLVGARGLQISDPSGERVVDSVDVAPRHRLDASGRHVVLIGERNLQVVDATAFVTSSVADQSR